MALLLIDAGGDVNRESGGWPPLFAAVLFNEPDNVRVLLAQPSLDFTIKFEGKTPEQYARDKGRPALEDMIAQEVSGQGYPGLFGLESAGNTLNVPRLAWCAACVVRCLR